MWPGVLKVEQDPLFQTTKNFAMAGAAVKARDNLRKYTIDFGTIGALRNALIPFITIVVFSVPAAFGGAIITETVFNWPGMGRLLIDAVDMRDYPVIQAEILLFSLEFILINLIVDVLYAVINPAIRYRS